MRAGDAWLGRLQASVCPETTPRIARECRLADTSYTADGPLWICIRPGRRDSGTD
jgi:hypothetical protein